MRLSLRALAAFLLSAVPASAQIRVSIPEIAPAFAAAPSAAAASAAFLPAAAPTPLPLAAAAPLPAALAPAPVLAPAAAPALLTAAPLAAAVDGFFPKMGLPGPAGSEETPSLSFGGRLFDGSSRLSTRSGSVFSPALTNVPGGVAFVRIQAAPAAPVKPVPNTQGLSGTALLQRVSQIAAAGQTRHEYHDASKYLFSTADNHALNGVHGVADAYSGIFVPGTSADGHDYTEKGDQDGDGYSRGQVMNVEHVFPQSLFKQDLPMRSDLHHLMATFEHPNGMRGSLPFGVVTGPADYSNNAGAKRGNFHFEPPDFTKGRVARAMLYFYTRYKDEPFFAPGGHAAAFWNPQIETLLDWNRRFPPTIEERARNDQVEAFQHNRNPFVDDPGLADRIGADALRAGGPAPRRAAAIVAQASPKDAPRRRSDTPRKGKNKKRKTPFKRSYSARTGRR
ncbi:MAG: endonuclease [Elusimicrobia bacterium]|nr:endonuclease [Elusimicrobiota bacterium]